MKIAIIGAPGSGKSTLAAGLFYNLKMMGKRVELVPELIKYKVYQGDSFSRPGFDVANTLEQQSLEAVFKDSDLEFLICEAPLCNGFFYSSFYKKIESDILKKIATVNINDYDVIIRVSLCSNRSFESSGRKEGLDASRKLEKHIEKKIKELSYKKKVIEYDVNMDIHTILNQLVEFKSKI